MRSFPRTVVSTCGLAILLIAGPTSEQVKKADDPRILELRKAAEQGNARAQFNLGLMYATGQGVPQDYVEAARWFRKAAGQGNASAQYNLGVMYYGRGVPQNYAEAARWYRKAADQGNASAQYNLGVMYYYGRGVPLDYVQAHMWLNLAASRASGDDLKTYADERDRAAKQMSHEQIAEAQRRAREWKPKSGADERGKSVK
jgi:TPR repeat protein